MNRSRFIVPVIVALAAFPFFVGAEDTEPSAPPKPPRYEERIQKQQEFMDQRAQKRDERMENREEKREERGMRLEERKTLWQENVDERRAKWMQFASSTASSSEKREARKLKFEEKKQERLTKIGTHAGEILAHLAERLGAFSDKVLGFIDRIQEKGIDTSEAEELLEEGDYYLENAKAAINGIDEEIAEVVSGEFSRDDVHALIQPIREDLRAAKDSYVKAIQALRDANDGEDRDFGADGAEE